MQNKENILLLGGNGFIGKNIIDYVRSNLKLSNKYKIIVLSRNTKKSEYNTIVYIPGDYCDKNVLINLFKNYNFTKVIHCATSTTPLTSENNILSDINGNLIATIGLLDVMNNFNCKSIIYLSSGGAVYGEKKIKKITENEICNPLSSYGVVKLTIENYLHLYKKQFGINFLILRVSNPFGKFHNSEIQGIINVIIKRAIKNDDIEIWGDGNQSKDYIFVEDLVKIIFFLIEKDNWNKTINIGSGISYKLNNILNLIKEYYPNLKIRYTESKLTDVKDFCLDISLLKSLIDFEFTNFKTSIKKTIEWEKSKQ
jgi:UDP-glucose 4-epimerase